MARLAKAVSVRGRKGDVLFLPGQDVPEWAQKLITNPHVWASDEQDEQDSPEADDVEPDEVDDTDDQYDDVEEDDSESTVAPPVPPKSGTGSGRDAWAAYASAYSVDVTDDMSRDDIFAALDEAGVTTSA